VLPRAKREKSDMDVIEAIRKRHSVRAFKKDPVPEAVLREILGASLRAPSWTNIQPWEFTVVGGSVMDEVRRTLDHAERSGLSSVPDIPWPTLPDVYNSRRRELGLSIYKVKNISREDTLKRQEWAIAGLRFFDAPNGIVFYHDKGLDRWALLDIGLIMQNVMLAALNYGLGTCPETTVARFPQVLRGLLNIPESKIIVCGIAIGYPVEEDPVNHFVSPREPLEKVSTWLGF